MSNIGSAARRRPAGWWRNPDLAWLGLALVAAAAFFWPASVGGRFFIIGDAWSESLPLRALAWQAIRNGEVPAWTTALMSGYPLLSMAQLGLGYPLSWGYLFSEAWGEQFYVLCPFVLAPAFVFAYVRTLGLSRPAAFLAGLSFGYGGMMASPITHNGMFSNSFMWVPLVLVCLERARTRPFIPCLLGAASAYAMAVLSGIGQGFMLAGLVILAYGLFLSLAVAKGAGWWSLDRWRAAAVAGLALVLAAGVGAFQIFETRRAHALSVRRELTYPNFSGGSASPLEIWESLVSPVAHHIADVNAYVAPIALTFALAAIGFTIVSRVREPRILFWTGLAAVALVLMLGAHTPLHPFLYHVPVFNLFRVPARHTAEWTLAAAILGAYGWDAVSLRWSHLTLASSRVRAALAAALVVVGLGISVWWIGAISLTSQRGYGLGKALITVSLLGAIALAFSLAESKLKFALLASAILLGCLPESYVGLRESWFPFTKTKARLATATATTKGLLQLDPTKNRVYSHVLAFEDERSEQPRLDAPNRTGWLGLHEAGGYEPLLLARYSQALGDVTLFIMAPDRTPHASLGDAFNLRSRALDVLNVTHVVRVLQRDEVALPPAWSENTLLDRVVLDFGQPSIRSHLQSGWSGDEQIAGRSGVWTDARTSSVDVQFSPTDAGYQLTVLCAPFGPAAPLEVQAQVNGAQLGKRTARTGWQELGWVVPTRALLVGANHVELTYSRTATPAATLPKTKDRRELALFVDQLALTPLP